MNARSKKATLGLAAGLVSLGMATASQAEVFGEFVFQGTVNGLDATAQPFQFDTYTFDVTNNTAQIINGFGIDANDNIAFFGSFLQAGGDDVRATPELDVDPLDFLTPGTTEYSDDTFFIGSGTLIIPDLVDTASELSASFLGSSGFTIAGGETKSIAFFSVAQGGDAPTGGFGAPALGNGQIIGRLQEIPEPTTLAVLGLGGVMLLGRRRSVRS